MDNRFFYSGNKQPLVKDNIHTALQEQDNMFDYHDNIAYRNI